MIRVRLRSSAWRFACGGGGRSGACGEPRGRGGRRGSRGGLVRGYTTHAHDVGRRLGSPIFRRWTEQTQPSGPW
eukprot:1183202-Prorocentrum_minimum.AAC.2